MIFHVHNYDVEVAYILVEGLVGGSEWYDISCRREICFEHPHIPYHLSFSLALALAMKLVFLLPSIHHYTSTQVLGTLAIFTHFVLPIDSIKS